MEFEERLIQILEQASSPNSAVTAAAAAIAQDELSDACGVFLAGPEGQLTLWARSGNAFDRTRETAESIAREALSRVGPAADEQDGQAMIAVPLLLRLHPIGALVVEREAGRPYATSEVRRLVAIASHIVGVIESARLIDMIDHLPEPPARAAPVVRQLERGERVLRGIAASSGVVIGVCAFRQTFPRSRLLLDRTPSSPGEERTRLRDAVEKTRNDLKRLQATIAGELGEEQALVFGSHLLFLADPMLVERVEQGIALGLSAAAAVDRSRSEIVGKLGLVGDPYIRERIEDLEDLCSRILNYLLAPEGDRALHPELVVSSRVTPSLVVELHGRGALGIASESGGATSHAVLLARGLGFPAVTGVTGLLEHAIPGELLIIDGDQGVVVLAPSATTLEDYRVLIERRQHARTEFARYRDRTPTSADGLRFALRANIAFGADIELAKANNAEGIGLYRTEFPFIVRDGIPTLEEQARIYRKAYHAFPDQPVILRILDLAADKLLLGGGLNPTPDVFQGYRSIRLLFDHPHILRDQIQAFAIAAGEHTLSILVPMVTSLEELRRIKELVAAALAELPETAARPAPRIGTLIEVPAAVEIAVDLARESDFLSIGTNDLMQYALVIDREDPRLSTPSDAYHPAVLRMIRRVVQAARAAGKEISVCGEIAARVELACALLALGVDALSVTPRVIPELKQRLAQVAVAPLQRDMQRILELGTAAELERALRDHVRTSSSF
jgi:phosphotransferase system enzyme I (PtsP)